MNIPSRRAIVKSSLIALLSGFAGVAFAQVPQVISPLFQVDSPPFSSLPDVPPPPPEDKFEMEDPDREELRAGALASFALKDHRADFLKLTTAASRSVFQTSLGTLPVTVSRDFPGLGRGFNANWVTQGLLPPDTTMAVGPTQIVQWVNLRLSVMDKNGAPMIGGANGYINGNAIWAALPATSVCRTSNQGDPLVAYDRLADRWVLSQFAFTLATATNGSGTRYPAAGSYRQCIAVSTTGDATGTYTLYEFAFSTFPDYGKIGVWPDGYYMTFNNFTFSTVTGASSFNSVTACAFDRLQMIATNPGAQAVCFNLGNGFFAMLPSDLDGNTPPPPGSPNYLVSQDWFFLNSPPYSVRLQKFHVDFGTPANSTINDGIGGPTSSFIKMPMPDLLGSCADNGGTCVAQPGTARVLDTLSMRPMYPLKYRNRNGVESLVFTHSIDPPGTATAGMNWVEIRSPGANPPVMRQNGVLAPADGLNRWMGSATMDKDGNIAMGYSVSSASVFPGIRIAGRLNSDILSRMRGELDVKTGTGSQTSASQRWGDYSTMQVDPVDDCTFWYTQEYMDTTSGADWSTQIIAFKFNSCQ